MKKIKKDKYNISDFFIGTTSNNSFKIIQPVSKAKNYLLNRNLHKSIGITNKNNYNWYIDLTGTRFYIDDKNSPIIVNTISNIQPLQAFIDENKTKYNTYNNLPTSMNLYQLIALDITINEIMLESNNKNNTFKELIN